MTPDPLDFDPLARRPQVRLVCVVQLAESINVMLAVLVRSTCLTRSTVLYVCVQVHVHSIHYMYMYLAHT